MEKMEYKVAVREFRDGEKVEVRVAERLYFEGMPLLNGYNVGDDPKIDAAAETVRDELSWLAQGRICHECFDGRMNVLYYIFPGLSLADEDVQGFVRALKTAGVDVDAQSSAIDDKEDASHV